MLPNEQRVGALSVQVKQGCAFLNLAVDSCKFDRNDPGCKYLLFIYLFFVFMNTKHIADINAFFL